MMQMSKTRVKNLSSEARSRTISSDALGSSYQLTRAKSGVCLKRTDKRQVGGREQLLITSLLFRDSSAFRDYCQADPLASADPFAAMQLDRAFHDLNRTRPE
jgi:hypothetical protein